MVLISFIVNYEWKQFDLDPVMMGWDGLIIWGRVEHCAQLIKVVLSLDQEAKLGKNTCSENFKGNNLPSYAGAVD